MPKFENASEVWDECSHQAAEKKLLKKLQLGARIVTDLTLLASDDSL